MATRLISERDFIQETDKILGISESDIEIGEADYQQQLVYVTTQFLPQLHENRNVIHVEVKSLMSIGDIKSTIPLREKAIKNQKLIDWAVQEVESLQKKINEVKT